jgi:hypothetical protein
MSKFYIPGLNIKTILLYFVLMIPGPAFSQVLKGKVLLDKTNTGIGYVNVVIVGKNIGTVADGDGIFSIPLDKISDNDSLRFSMIGYESKSIIVRQIKEDSTNYVYLTPKLYSLQEVKVVYHKPRKPKEIILGTSVTTDLLKSGFENNNLGSELGIKVHSRGRVKLEDINLNVATCTYDSVTYRLNIYQIINETGYKNILTQPIYISFSKDMINHVITYDLTKYSITVEDDILVALELYKDLGEGSLLFRTEFFTGSTFHRKTIEGDWNEAAGVIGMYLHGQLLR